MADFNAKAQRDGLDKMVSRLSELLHAEGGNNVAAKLYDEINKEWCRLTPQQQKATAELNGTTDVFKDGNSQPMGIQARGVVVPLHCEDSGKR